MDEIFDRGLLPFSIQPWWTQFIVVVQENQNDFSYLPVDEVPPIPTKTLHWAFNTAADLLDDSELRRKEKILSYVTSSASEVGMFKFLEIYAHLGTSLPIGLKISAMLREFVNPRNGQFRTAGLKQLITLDATHILFEVLEELGKETVRCLDKDAMSYYHAITVNTIWILSAVAKKDPHFVSDVLTQSRLKFWHEVVQRNFFHPKNEVHYPCLKILRVLVKVSKVGHLLAKDKFFKTLCKMMNQYQGQPSTKSQMVLEILVMLTRTSKAQCKRFLKAGCLITLMRMFSFWPIWRGHGLPKMSKCVLNVYLQLATTYAGRKALIQSDALLNIRQFCESCPNDKQFDDVITRAYAINSLTYGKHKLPFKDITSPAKFDLPQGHSTKRVRDSGTSSDEDDPDDIEEDEKVNQRPSASDFDEDDVDGELGASDIELDDDDEVTLTTDIKVETRKLDSRSRLPGVPSGDSLVGYREFFREFECGVNGNKSNTEIGRRLDSVVAGLLGQRVSIVTHDARIPQSELRQDLLGGKPYYFEGSIPVDILRKTYLAISNQVRSVIPFVKVAYPEITFAYGGKKMELTTPVTDRFVVREKIVELMERTAGVGSVLKPLVVYDLDALLHNHNTNNTNNSQSKTTKSKVIHSSFQLENDDEVRVGEFRKNKSHSLKFESRFEGGNLRKAIQVGEREYDLYLMSDVNSGRHNQWFYFQVSNTPNDISITFNIVNCIKTSSQFNFGMQPVLFSVTEAILGKPGWVRAGSNVMYYRNGYRNFIGKKRKYYYSATFSIHFPKKGDICYIAYHYPYSYSRLLTELWRLTKMASDEQKLYVRYDVLCRSENDNEVPLMTVTALDDPRNPIQVREVIFLSSRVHPGEPNSSWVMHGILHQLLFGSGMSSILKRYVFKILPILNVEGVINGCGRCGLTDEDLNRRWKDPDPKLHPSIFHTKGLIEYCCKIRNKIPALYCDLHGHSRRKNVFFYGCSFSKSWCPEDQSKDEDPREVEILPAAMARRNPTFQISYCKYDVRKERETTARVALWREFGIAKSYTLESSYCGCDRGPYKGVCIGITQLIEVGESLCQACADLDNPLAFSVSGLDFVPMATEWGDDHGVVNGSKINLINFPEESRYKTPLSSAPVRRQKTKRKPIPHTKASKRKKGTKRR